MEDALHVDAGVTEGDEEREQGSPADDVEQRELVGARAERRQQRRRDAQDDLRRRVRRLDVRGHVVQEAVDHGLNEHAELAAAAP